MPDLNLTDNAANLAGQLLDQLKADVLGTLTDPESIAEVERATMTLAVVPVLMIGATPEVAADLTNQFNAALAVLYSLASAGVEDAAHARAAVQKRVFDIVNVVLTDAIKVGFGALKLALV
jgi:glucosamine 6-phosphate synthetase-like amidotransferase/phosphosugar isomerase protein